MDTEQKIRDLETIYAALIRLVPNENDSVRTCLIKFTIVPHQNRSTSTFHFKGELDFKRLTDGYLISYEGVKREDGAGQKYRPFLSFSFPDKLDSSLMFCYGDSKDNNPFPMEPYLKLPIIYFERDAEARIYMP